MEGLDIRLIGAPSPDGQIYLRELGGIAVSLHDLDLRIGRELDGTPGAGRTRRTVEADSNLRLVGLSSGSVRLGIEFGEGVQEQLAVDSTTRIEDRF